MILPLSVSNVRKDIIIMIHSFYVKVASYIAISVRAKANANLVNQIIKSLMDFVGVKRDILTIKNNARNAPKIV